MTPNPLPHSEAPLPKTSKDETLKQAVKIAYRPFQVTDRGFILKSWLKNHRKNMAGIPDEEYFNGQTYLIFALASKSKVIIACDADAPEFILGFICGRMAKNLDDAVIDFVYVKETYRHNGIARDLVSHIGYRGLGKVICTHWSRTLIAIANRYPLIFNPYVNTIGAPDV